MLPARDGLSSAGRAGLPVCGGRGVLLRKGDPNGRCLGQHCRRAFTLILPGSQVGIAPGDRVYEGIGPTVTAEQWDDFIPAAQPRLWQVESVQPFYWEGTVCHVQAEGEKE